jgi:predicted dehydrogenase
MDAEEKRVTRIAVVGLGLVGRSRLSAIMALRERGRPLELAALMDPYLPDAEAVAVPTGAPLVSSLGEVLARDPDWVVVAVPHGEAVDLLPTLLESGVNVLVEKPLGRSAAEAELLAHRCSRPDQLWVGFNYRFFEGVAALLVDAGSGRFGPLVSLSILMGHGGSPGDQESWKLDPVQAGGGALIDPGVHLLDLCRLLAGNSLHVVGGKAWRGFWRTGVEEECHILMTGEYVPIINVTVSIVRWRSTFRIELFGMEGYGIVEGRNRSYGSQTYRRGRRWGWQTGKSQIESEEHVVTAAGDDVYEREIDTLVFGFHDGPIRACPADEAIRVMELVDQCRKTLGIPVQEVPAGGQSQ